MRNTFNSNALSRLATAYANKDSEFDLTMFANDIITYYQEHGNIDAFSSLFNDGGAAMVETLKGLQSETNVLKNGAIDDTINTSNVFSQGGNVYVENRQGDSETNDAESNTARTAYGNDEGHSGMSFATESEKMDSGKPAGLDKESDGLEVFEHRSGKYQGGTSKDRTNDRNGSIRRVENKTINEVCDNEDFIKLAHFVGDEISHQTQKELIKYYSNDERLIEGYDFSDVITYDMLANPDNELRGLFADEIEAYFNTQNSGGVNNNGTDSRADLYQNDNRYSEMQTEGQAGGVSQIGNNENITKRRTVQPDRYRYRGVEKSSLDTVCERDAFINLSRFVGNEISEKTRDDLYRKYQKDTRITEENYDFSDVITYDMLANPDNELRGLFADEIEAYFYADKSVGADITGKKIDESVFDKLKNTVVKDENGRLIPVYHATNKEFDKFEIGDIGFHFGSYAQAYKRAQDQGYDNPTFIKAYLNITNPLVIEEDFSGWNAFQIAKKLKELGLLTEKEALDYVKASREDKAKNNASLAEILKSKGYDGIVYNNNVESVNGKAYLVFDDSQIIRIDDGGSSTDVTDIHDTGKSSETNNRYYLHEVSDNEGNIIIIKKDDASFKSKSEADNDNSSLGETSPNNIVSQYDNVVNDSIRNNAENDASKDKITKVSNAIEKTLRPEILSNNDLMSMLADKFDGGGISGLADEILARYEQGKSIGDFESLFSDGGKGIYDVLNDEQSGNAKYSISTESEDSSIFEASEETITSFSAQIDRWLKGEMKPSEQFELGTTPYVLQVIGAENLPVMMNQNVLVKITGEKHSISLDEIAKMPNAIADPIMVFKSETVNNAFVVLTELIDKNGNDVVVAMHLNKHQDRIKINRIASVYGKNGVINFVSNQIKNGNLKYMDKNKSQNWSTSRGLQLPKLVQSNPDNNIILQKYDIVNSYYMQQDAKYSAEGEIDNGRNSLLSDGSGKRTYGTGTGKQTKRVDGRTRRYREGRTAAYERRKYCRTLKASGLTQQKIIYGHKCEVIPPEHYTPRMNKMAEQNKKNGFAETIFITGKAEIPFVKDKNGTSKKSKGIYIKANGKKIVVVQYDNEFYTPEQINDHETIHDRYHTPLVQKAKNIIINSLPVSEKKRVLENLARDYNGIIDNEVKEDLIEEFVANVLSDMEYAYSEAFAEIQRAYWAGDEQFIDNYKVSEYTESIDTGGITVETLNSIGIGKDYRLSGSDNSNAFVQGSLVNEYQDALTSYEWKQYFDKVNQLDWDADTRNRKFDFVVVIDNKIIKSHYNKTRPQVYSVEYLKSGQTVKSLLEEEIIYDQDTRRILETLATSTEQNNQGTVDTNLYGSQGQGKIGENVSAPVEKDGQPSRNNDSVDTIHSPIKQEDKSVKIKYALGTNDVNTDFWEEWLNKAKEYGVIPKGENPARDIDVPKKISETKVVSKFARTMLEAGVTPETAVSEFEQRILEGSMTYEVITNENAKKWAAEKICIKSRQSGKNVSNKLLTEEVLWIKTICLKRKINRSTLPALYVVLP